MLGTSLEFARGTTPDCERLVASLFKPGELLGGYRLARKKFRTPDLVLVTSAHDPSGFEATPRRAYVERLRRGMGRNGEKMVRALALGSKSAQAVATLPREADAFWLVVNRRDAVPVMVVLFAAEFATGDDAREPGVGVN